MSGMMTGVLTGGAELAATGSDVFPWLIIGIIVVALGIVAFVVGQVVRRRREAADGGATGGADDLGSPGGGDSAPDSAGSDTES